METYKTTMPGLFDMTEDEGGTLRMPFNPANYGIHYDILRQCHICNCHFPQGQLKELSVGETNEGAIHGEQKLYPHSWFFCKECWLTNEISDVGKWTA